MPVKAGITVNRVSKAAAVMPWPPVKSSSQSRIPCVLPCMSVSPPTTTAQPSRAILARRQARRYEIRADR